MTSVKHPPANAPKAKLIKAILDKQRSDQTVANIDAANEALRDIDLDGTEPGVTTPEWVRLDANTWTLPGLGKVLRRDNILRADGYVTRYIPFSVDGKQLNNGWRNLADAQASVEAHAQGRTY